MNWLRRLWAGSAKAPEPVAADPAPPPSQTAPEDPVAIISDIHGNLQALRAVLEDIAAQGVREIVCLGDIVGYGGNPAECVDLIRAAGIPCVRGNHDAYAGGTTPLPEGRGPAFERACHWMRETLGDERCRWLGSLPLTLSGHDFEAVHTSLHQPARWDYLTSQPATKLHFQHQQRSVSFVGHTHMPAMWVEGMDRPAAEGGIEPLRPDRKQVVNVGSVGQPRDEDPNACYTIYRRKERDIWWRRVPYDIPGAQEAIHQAKLPAKNAVRLERGK